MGGNSHNIRYSSRVERERVLELRQAKVGGDVPYATYCSRETIGTYLADGAVVVFYVDEDVSGMCVYWPESGRILVIRQDEGVVHLISEYEVGDPNLRDDLGCPGRVTIGDSWSSLGG